jgi:hypothetical protein
MNSSKVRARFWLESALAASCGLLASMTVFWRDWVEAATGFDPDRRSGSFEWALVAALLLLCTTASLLARTEWRRPHTAAATGG